MAGLRPQHALVVLLAALGAPPALSAAVSRARTRPPTVAQPRPSRAQPRRPVAPRAYWSRYAGATGRLLRIPLVLDRGPSALTQPELEAIVGEMNRIWRPAKICFEVREVRWGYGPRRALTLRFVAADEPFVNGYFEDEQHVWAQDEPHLGRAPTPARWPAARTAAHELGHALGLRHVPRTGDSLDALMNTGYDGYRLSGEEIDQARRTATRYALPLGGTACRMAAL